MLGEAIKAVPKEVKGTAAGLSERADNVQDEFLTTQKHHGAITHHYKMTKTQTVDIVSEEISDADKADDKQKTKATQKKRRWGCCCFGKLGDD